MCIYVTDLESVGFSKISSQLTFMIVEKFKIIKVLFTERNLSYSTIVHTMSKNYKKKKLKKSQNTKYKTYYIKKKLSPSIKKSIEY